MELCVMCGAVLPDESNSHVCKTCVLTTSVQFMNFTCPECGKKLKLMSKYVTHYRPATRCGNYAVMSVDLIYHCDHCGSDWDSEYNSDEWSDETQSKLTRHFWG